MFRHVVLFTWTKESSPDQQTAVATELRKLPAAIPEIRAYHVGPDAGVNNGNFAFAVVADFDRVEDYLIYRDHPVHQEIIAQHIRPIMASRAAVQYEA
jgi:hypothetical protein